jgi:RimJ/RimL family protein N-acetyltransferase
VESLNLKLLDGSEVVVRPIRSADKGALVAGFEQLSEQSRYQRFLTGIKELSESEVRYLTEVDHHDHEALIAFGPEGEAVGVARFVRADDPLRAEAAVAVIDSWQGRGLGTALTNLLADRARDEGVECFTALVLASNTQMQDVLATLGPGRVISRQAGTVELEVGVPPEGIGEMAGVLRVLAGGAAELATPPWGMRPVAGAEPDPA